MDNIETIPIAGNRNTIIDKEDFERCSRYRWQVRREGKSQIDYVSGYLIGNYKNRIKLHRFIMGLNKGDSLIVHHINGNTLDNRKENLQIMTHSKHCKLKWAN